MGDGPAERAGPGFLRINMDPLVIARSLGERINTLLVDGHPLGNAQTLAYGLFQGACVIEGGGHGDSPEYLVYLLFIGWNVQGWVPSHPNAPRKQSGLLRTHRQNLARHIARIIT